MKKQYKISIEKPCSEDWNSFKPRSNGSFCDACQKTVTDFTSMGDKEISAFIAKSSGKTCGRFRANQLSQVFSPLTTSNRNNIRQLLSASLASLSLVLLSSSGIANSLIPKNKVDFTQLENQIKKDPPIIMKSHKISGVVTGEDGTTIPGIYVVLKGTTHGTTTDLDGRFTFPVEVNDGDILVFSFIGYETQEYKIRKDMSAEITMEMTLDYCILMGDLAIEEVYVSKPKGIKRFWVQIKSLFSTS